MEEAFQMTSALSGTNAEYKPIVESTRDGGFVVGLRIKTDNSVSDPILDGIQELGRDFNVVVFKLKGGKLEWVYQSSRAVKEVVDLAIDSLGNILLVGETSNWSDPKKGEYGYSNVVIVKLSPEGGLIWQKIFGGSQADMAQSIAVGTDNRVFVSAISNSMDYDVPYNNGGGDWWIFALDKSGDLIWSKVLGGSTGEGPEAIISTDDGGCLTVGFSLSSDKDFDTNLAGYDAWAVRLDNAGEVQWRTRLGSSGRDEFIGGKEYAGNFYLLGNCNYWDGNIDTSTWKGGGDYWLVKLSGAGEVISQKLYGSNKGERSVDMAFIPSGPQFVVVGETEFYIGAGNRWDISKPRVGPDSWGGGNDWWILVVDTNLLAVDDFIYGGNYPEYCSSVAANRSSFVVCGSTSSNDGNVKDYKGVPSRYDRDRNLWIVEISTGVAGVQTVADSKVESCLDVHRNFSDKAVEIISLCHENNIQQVEIFDLTGKQVPTQMQDREAVGSATLHIQYLSEVTTSLFVVIRMNSGEILYKVV